MALTPKQERFVSEYLVDLNATQAAIRAGYSARNADKIGPELLGKTRIAEAIQEAQAERAVRCELTQDLVLQRLQEEAEYKGEGASHSARVSAWKLIGQHLGMFKDAPGNVTTNNTQVILYLPKKDDHETDPPAASSGTVPA